jgi:hypothetical protein
MNCRRVTIETPGSDRFISINVAEFPDTPEDGARIQISYIGANFGKAEIEEVIEKLGRPSVAAPRGSISSHTRKSSFYQVTRYAGYKEGSFFAGQEIAGVINRLGSNVEDAGLSPNQAVIVFPFDGLTNIVQEILAVEDISNLIAVPKNIPLSVAATFPCGGLLSMFAVSSISRNLNLLAMKIKDRNIKILVVGTGGLSLWTLSLLTHFMKERKEGIKLYVTSANDAGLDFARKEYPG